MKDEHEQTAPVSRRRFLQETGLTILAAGSASVLSAPFISRAMA